MEAAPHAFRLLRLWFEYFAPLSMAESHDIEYGGSGREGHVSVGSEGYFRDYTPGETAVSLGEDGQIV